MENEKLNTEFLLTMRHKLNPMIPLEDVARDYLAPNVNLCEIKRKARSGNLPFAVVISGTGKATTYHVPIVSLAKWIDKTIEDAINDHHAMHA